MPYPTLTSPITVGSLALKNRMAMSAMATYRMVDADGSSNERHRAYYEARARGGVGLIVTEGTLVHPSGQSWPHSLSIYDDRFAPSLAELARTIKESPLTMGHGEGGLAGFAAAVKSEASIPVMTVGRYLSLASAEAVLAAGKADLVAFGRALLADPELVAKSLRGEERNVVPCVACEACRGFYDGTSCLLNPETSYEHELRLTPPTRRRRVLVLGSGVAGLELARVAARRGHEATVATAGLPFGGLLTLRAGVPGAAEVGKGVKYFQLALAELGVRIVDQPPAEPFDVVVEARPGSPILPSLPGRDPAGIIVGDDVLVGRTRTDAIGRRVAVIGPGIFAGETALYLAAAGKEVTLLASGTQPMKDANPLIAGRTTLDFAARGGRMIASARLLDVGADGALDVEVNGRRHRTGPFDKVVAAIGWQPPARPAGKEVYVLADVWDAAAALRQAQVATRIGRQI